MPLDKEMDRPGQRCTGGLTRSCTPMPGVASSLMSTLETRWPKR
jgi:hypothetical protein